MRIATRQIHVRSDNYFFRLSPTNSSKLGFDVLGTAHRRIHQRLRVDKIARHISQPFRRSLDKRPHFFVLKSTAAILFAARLSGNHCGQRGLNIINLSP